MLRDGSHDLLPVTVVIDSVNFPERLVHVRNGSDEGRSFADRAPDSLPVERVTPTIALAAGAASFLKYSQKVDRATVVPLVIQIPSQKTKAHCVMCVRDREPLAFPEELSCRGYKSFGENDRSDCQRPEKRLAIVERFDVSA